MFWIPLIAALAASAAGSYFQGEGAKKSQQAVNDANEQERMRQKELQDRSMQLFNSSFEYNDPNAQMQREKEAQNKYNNLFQQSSNETLDSILQGQNSMDSSANSPRAIGEAYKAALSKGKARLQSQLGAKATLAGLGDVLSQSAIQNQRTLNAQTTLGGFMRGSSAILPMELQNASHAGDNLSGIGSTLSSLGGLGFSGVSAYAAGHPSVTKAVPTGRYFGP
jgi:hypothetical protein